MLECQNCHAKGEDVYLTLVLAGGGRLTYCRECYAAVGRLVGETVLATSESRYDPRSDAYVYAGDREAGPAEALGESVFRPGDSFPLLVWGSTPMRVVVGRPGEGGGVIAAAAVREWEGQRVVLMSPEEATALQRRARGGGSAEDDAP